MSPPSPVAHPPASGAFFLLQISMFFSWFITAAACSRSPVLISYLSLFAQNLNTGKDNYCKQCNNPKDNSKSNCQSIVIKLMNFPTLLITTQNSNYLNQMSWYWRKKVKSCKKKIKSCLVAIVGHPPKNALYNTMQMVMVDSCDKLIICFLWVLKGGKHNYWWQMASIIKFTTL